MRAVRRWVLGLVVGMIAVACDRAPTAAPSALVPRFSTSSTQIHILQQAPTAPLLQAYRVSFWARRGTQTTLFLNYRPLPALQDPHKRAGGRRGWGAAEQG